MVLVGIAPSIGRADLLISNFAGLGPGSVFRYAESNGAFLGNAGFGGETTEDIHLGPANRLYVASNNIGAGAIRRFDWTTGTYLGDLVADGQDGFRSPGGFIFGTDGNLYATSNNIQGIPGGVTGVMKFNGTTGAYLGLFVAPGSGGIGTPFQLDVMPVTGDLLVSDGFRINRYNKTTGAFVSTFVAPGAGGLSSIGDLTIGPDGNLYAASTSQDVVARFNGQTGAFLGILASGLNDPVGIAFGNDGNLYVSSGGGGSGAVRRYNGTTGAFMDVFINDQSHLPIPFRMAFTPEPATAIAAIAFGALFAGRHERCRKGRRNYAAAGNCRRSRGAGSGSGRAMAAVTAAATGAGSILFIPGISIISTGAGSSSGSRRSAACFSAWAFARAAARNLSLASFSNARRRAEYFR
jgi:hypothetical protein